MKKMTIISFAIASLSLSAVAYPEGSKDSNAEISAHLSGTAFVTTDLEGSVDFYTRFLGFRERRRAILDTPAGLTVFGVAEGGEILYVAMVPAKFSDENQNFPGLNFAQILDSESSPNARDARRGPVAGELVMAFSVQNLKKIESDMRADDVPVVAPLALSATGKSMTLTVLDPNGVRIQLYEYVAAE